MSLVEMQGIGKRFGSLAALSDVSFSADAGRIQAVVGENGAGKTTLMKCLSGEHSPDSGSIRIDGQEARLRTPKDAKALGVGMVSQHYAIIPDLSCLQNLMLGDEPGQILRLGEARERAESLAQRMGFQFEWASPASTLSPGSAQKLEILKLLWRGARIMILDEPTAMLSPADSDSLYDSLEDLAQKGACVIVVTHRIPEVLERCRDVAVLRGGRLIEARPVEGLTSDRLAELIIGEGPLPRVRQSPRLGEVLLELQSASAKDGRGHAAVREACLRLKEGEVVGLAGVDGSGQKELFDLILGLAPLASGQVLLHGMPAPPEPSQRIALGVRLIPEDRLAQGAAEARSLKWNAVLGLQRLDLARRGPWLDRAAQAGFASRALDLFETRRTSLKQPLSDLSGGNQQRFVAGRALGSGPRIILAFQPTRGLDIKGTAAIYGEIRRLCREEGAAALVVSFDLDELLEEADRIVVMREGLLMEAEKTRPAVGRLMVGASA